MNELQKHQALLKNCTQCKKMFRPPITGNPNYSKILLLGQAPGDKEPALGRPFAWTAGKTLFKWFKTIGLNEADVRERVFMAAVCRCFPGKNPKGGDRVPTTEEIDRCSIWLKNEFDLLKPELLIPVGKLAISQFINVTKLTDVIGQQHQIEYAGQKLDMIPLPHPSGASTWHRMEPGKSLLQDALGLINAHKNWQHIKKN